MVVTAKVASDGRVLLPDSVAEEAGIEPGDVVTLQTTGLGTIEIQLLQRLTLAELLERYQGEGPYDEKAVREAWQDEAATEVFGIRDD